MKRSRLGILVLCALIVWMVIPAWAAEEAAQETAAPVQTQAEPQAEAQPAEPAAQPAAEQPAAQPAEGQPATAPPATAEGVQIQDAVVCQDVVDRAPVGSGDVFAKEIARVFCFCRVVGAEGASSIIHNWYYKGALKASVKLPVRSNNWRTYSSKTLTPEWAGEWMVEILSESGTPLESITFFIQ